MKVRFPYGDSGLFDVMNMWGPEGCRYPYYGYLPDAPLCDECSSTYEARKDVLEGIWDGPCNSDEATRDYYDVPLPDNYPGCGCDCADFLRRDLSCSSSSCINVAQEYASPNTVCDGDELQWDTTSASSGCETYGEVDTGSLDSTWGGGDACLDDGEVQGASEQCYETRDDYNDPAQCEFEVDEDDGACTISGLACPDEHTDTDMDYTHIDSSNNKWIWSGTTSDGRSWYENDDVSFMVKYLYYSTRAGGWLLTATAPDLSAADPWVGNNNQVRFSGQAHGDSPDGVFHDAQIYCGHDTGDPADGCWNHPRGDGRDMYHCGNDGTVTVSCASSFTITSSNVHWDECYGECAAIGSTFACINDEFQNGQAFETFGGSCPDGADDCGAWIAVSDEAP